MNDTENLAPHIHNENAVPDNPQKQIFRRKPLGKPLGQVESLKPRRRALGDITNSARQPAKPLQKQKSSATPKLNIWRDAEDVPEPEIIPPPPPARPYEPAPLFSARELADLRREIEEEEDDGTDDFGRPFMTREKLPIPPLPFSQNDDDGDDDIRPREGLTKDYFSPDQMFPKEELPALELA